MAENKVVILGIGIDNRILEVSDVQAVLTKYGCSIRTRVGLHEVQKDYCAQNGVIVLELYGDSEDKENIVKELDAIEGVQVKQMIFD
ncbi:MAG: hypothetical protein ACLFSQ_11450 [Candidatus Zixiibacteriota bacterium]